MAERIGFNLRNELFGPMSKAESERLKNQRATAALKLLGMLPTITIDWADYMDGSEPAASQTLQWPMPVVWVSEEEAREMFPARQETARLCICCGAPAGLVQHD